MNATPLADQFRAATDAFRAFAEALVVAAYAAVDLLAGWWSPALVTRFAVERLGLTEVDVRYVDGLTVRTWNRMTHHVDPVAFAAWCSTAGQS